MKYKKCEGACDRNLPVEPNMLGESAWAWMGEQDFWMCNDCWHGPIAVKPLKVGKINSKGTDADYFVRPLRNGTVVSDAIADAFVQYFDLHEHYSPKCARVSGDRRRIYWENH